MPPKINEPNFSDASAVLLKYISLHAPFLAMNIDSSIALTAWFCNQKGRPCLCAGVADELPLDQPTLMVFISSDKLNAISSNDVDACSEILDSIAHQLRQQSQDIEPLNSAAKSFIKDLFVKDPELRTIKQTFFSSHLTNSLSH